MNKKNKGFTTIELITSFTLASVIMLILFNIILILKDNLSEVNAKTNMLVEKDNLSYNINKRFKEKELSSVTMCDEGDKCYEFKYSDDTSDKLVYSKTDKSITFNNYTFDIIDGITVEEPTITEHYDTMSSTTYNGYFIINIPIKLDNKDYSIKINKHFNTDSLVMDIGNYYDNNGNRYTKVEYLESTGTQYIDTDYIPKINTKVELELNFSGNFKNTGCTAIFGTYNRLEDNYSAFTLNFGGELSQNLTLFPWVDKQYGFGGINSFFDITSDILQNKNLIEFGSGIVKYGTVTREIVTKTTINSTTLRLFGYGHCSSTLTFDAYLMYVYSFKIYEGDILKRDYIPVIDSTERPCLFDKVEKKCYYNQGTGEFLWG